MKNEIKLLPCPFCGGEPFMDKQGAAFKIICPRCITVQMISIKKETAIEAWNKRKPKTL